MRSFTFITLGAILEQLREELKDKLPADKLWHTDANGIRRKKYPISRMTFYRNEEKLGLLSTKQEREKGEWRTYSPEEAELIKAKIKERYGLV